MKAATILSILILLGLAGCSSSPPAPIRVEHVHTFELHEPTEEERIEFERSQAEAQAELEAELQRITAEAISDLDDLKE